ncbi:Flagellin is the subunit protein which polymerizes to form the filaments of bacterial flagella [Basidiobolus ranarum]|uniref:Flagellin is the subunit protein which polymerizes to form the filaments of bacterial flagella n=1 Tax=Basidiobolus ranarum TaxID=34480 RepID=A0ABR2WLT1_9FUNG
MSCSWASLTTAYVAAFEAQIGPMTWWVDEDRILLAKTAERALQHVADNIQTIHELVVQARNDNCSPAGLQAIQEEIDQRLVKIDRIFTHTNVYTIQIFNHASPSFRDETEDQAISTNANINVATLGLSRFDATNIETSSLTKLDEALLQINSLRSSCNSALADLNFNSALDNLRISKRNTAQPWRR